MDPHQEFDLDDFESDSGCPSDILSLEGMFSWSECGDSYTEGSDLPRSPLLSDAGEEPRFVWPDFDDGALPVVPAGPVPYVGDLRGIPAGEESSDEDDFGLSLEIPAGCAGYLRAFLPQPFGAEGDGAVVPGPSRRRDSCEFSAGAETDAEGDEPMDIVDPAPDFSNDVPWYHRSVYWEGRYEDLMKDLDEEF